MKKTIVALAVAAFAATSANAATVFNQDGTKVDVSGSVRLLLQKESGKRTDLKDKGSRVSFKASHELGGGLSALAYTELRFSRKEFGDSVTLKRLYAGFDYEGVGTLTFGKQLTIGDDIELAKYNYNLTGVNRLVTSGDKVVHFKSANFNGFRFGADYVLAKDPSKNDAQGKKLTNKNAFVVGALYSRTMGEFGFGLKTGYSQERVSQDVKNRAFTVATELSYGPFAAGVDYSQEKSSKDAKQVEWRDSVMYNKVRELELGLKYQIVEPSKVYSNIVWGKAEDNMNKARLRAYVFGVDYKLHKQVITYLEGGTFRYKKDNVSSRDNKVGVGLRVYF